MFAAFSLDDGTAVHAIFARKTVKTLTSTTSTHATEGPSYYDASQYRGELNPFELVYTLLLSYSS